jgi:hypothetical protein
MNRRIFNPAQGLESGRDGGTEVGPPERDKTDGPLGLNDVWVGGCSASNRLY